MTQALYAHMNNKRKMKKKRMQMTILMEKTSMAVFFFMVFVLFLDCLLVASELQ
jgi:hypothetical protein